MSPRIFPDVMVFTGGWEGGRDEGGWIKKKTAVQYLT